MTTFDTTTLSDEQLGLCLEEMRKRGYAVAVYGALELGEGPLSNEDGGYDEAKVKAFLAEHREALEDAMCSGVWDYIENEQIESVED